MRRRAARPVQPADAEQRHEDRRLDDQRAAVGGRPELATADSSVSARASPVGRDHDHREERDRREAVRERPPLARRRRRAWDDVTSASEAAEPDRRGAECARSASAASTRGWSGSSECPESVGAASSASAQAPASGEELRDTTAPAPLPHRRPARPSPRPSSRASKRVPGGAPWTMLLPPRNAKSSAKKSRCASGRRSRSPSEAAHDEPEDRRAAADEQSEVVERPQHDVAPARAASTRRAPSEATRRRAPTANASTPFFAVAVVGDDAPADAVGAVRADSVRSGRIRMSPAAFAASRRAPIGRSRSRRPRCRRRLDACRRTGPSPARRACRARRRSRGPSKERRVRERAGGCGERDEERDEAASLTSGEATGRASSASRATGCRSGSVLALPFRADLRVQVPERPPVRGVPRHDGTEPETCEVCGAAPLQVVLHPVAVHYKGSGLLLDRLRPQVEAAVEGRRLLRRVFFLVGRRRVGRVGWVQRFG